VAKVTSKLQLTVPKVIADQYRIRPGDELEWIPAGDAIRVVPVAKARKHGSQAAVKQRLELFDFATRRQHQREVQLRKKGVPASETAIERGWTRKDLYSR
jgi:bifunctional DNA-binding transcriptional regulator/antitoxin component of YhaV-PrlF toxin-antitoxin module